MIRSHFLTSENRCAPPLRDGSVLVRPRTIQYPPPPPNNSPAIDKNSIPPPPGLEEELDDVDSQCEQTPKKSTIVSRNTPETTISPDTIPSPPESPEDLDSEDHSDCDLVGVRGEEGLSSESQQDTIVKETNHYISIKLSAVEFDIVTKKMHSWLRAVRE